MALAINLQEDICPISEFRANTNSLIKKMKEVHRPIVLTQNGKTSAIVLDIADYQSMVDELDFVRELNEARKQIDNGEFTTNDDLKKELLQRLN
jgi:prevent-host-death family protein